MNEATVLFFDYTLPSRPTRAEVCGVRMTFQGLEVDLPTYAKLPWFEPALAWLPSYEERRCVYAAKRLAGDRHVSIAVSSRYAEAGTPYLTSPGKDFVRDGLDQLRALVLEVVREGFLVVLHLAGDGQSQPPATVGYNDPVGWTYGYEAMLCYLPSVVAALKTPVDLTPYVLFCPGFDGVFYGWQPEQVDAFGKVFRRYLPNGYLAIEHDPGHLPVGNAEADWDAGGAMVNYDTLLSEFFWPVTGDQLWQVAARTLGPVYQRPADEPVDDDPRPPHYLRHGTSRGPYFTVAWEFAAYEWVRGQLTAEQVDVARQALRRVGYTYVG